MTTAPASVRHWSSQVRRQGRSLPVVALAVVLLVALSLAGCSVLRPAHVPEPGQVFELRDDRNLVFGPAVYTSPERIVLPSATFLVTSNVTDAVNGDFLPDYPEGVEAPEGHDLVTVDLTRGVGVVTDAEPAQIEVLIDQAVVQVPSEGVLPPPLTQGRDPLVTQFALVVPQDGAAQLRFTDAGRTVLYDLRAGGVDASGSTARLECASVLKGYSATPGQLETEGVTTGPASGVRGLPAETRPFTVRLDLGVGLSGATSGLSKTGYLPSKGWAPDGMCYLLISDNKVSSDFPQAGSLDLQDSLSFTPEGGTPVTVDAAGSVYLSVLGDADQFVITVPVDVHTGTLTFTPSVTLPEQEITTPPPPVTSTLTF